MKKYIARHERKFINIFKNDFKRFKKPVILEFGVSVHALSTSIFLKECEKKNGKLYSVDVIDYSYHFKSKKWKFIKSRDDNFRFINKNIPKRFDVIYLDTIHKAEHVKKMFYHYYDKLKVNGLFVIDDTSMLPYLSSREKNNFSLEVNNHETFQILLEILNSNHTNFHLEFSFIGTGAAKITKLNNRKLKINHKLNDRKSSLKNILRKIYLYFR